MHIFKSIHTGDKDIENIEKDQKELKSYLSYVKHGNPKNRSKEQEKTINNIENLYNSREEVVKMFNDYPRKMYRNIYDSKQKGTGLKILTPKQMTQRLCSRTNKSRQ